MDLCEIPITPASPDNGKHADDSIKIIHAIVDEEIAAGVSPASIVVGGFSQGAALALAAVLKYPQQLGGCVMLSGWALPRQQLALAAEGSASKAAGFFVGHGMDDEVVTYDCARQVNTMLKAAGCANVSFKSYGGLGHGPCAQETVDLVEFLSTTVHRKACKCKPCKAKGGEAAAAQPSQPPAPPPQAQAQDAIAVMLAAAAAESNRRAAVEEAEAEAQAGVAAPTSAPAYEVLDDGKGGIRAVIQLPDHCTMQDLEVDVHDEAVDVRRLQGAGAFELRVAFGAAVDRARAVAKFSAAKSQLTIKVPKL
jgi:predicted esterase/HSP20 family molecular chaperone IbpA